MKNHSFFSYVRISTGALLFLLSATLLAQPSGNSILDDVFITNEEMTANIHITFSCTVRYITHHPHDHGDEVRINVKPFFACNTEDNTVFQRESIKPENNEIAMLEDVTYENEIESGAFLILHFRKSVLFEVKQSSDFRSIDIIIHQENKLE